MNNEIMSRENSRAAVKSVEETAAIADIQAKMILARNFPRDIQYVREMIAFECQNKELAETAVYEFPRGDSVVTGASIRLVECVARHYGNILCGIKEIQTVGDRATVRAYAWDLQTNFQDEKVFDVELVRSTKKGTYRLTDPRDRYEMMANQAARRKRACIQAVIPQFIINEAVDLCKKTLKESVGKDGKTIEQVREEMLAAFRLLADWITPEDFKTVCGKDFDHLNAQDIVKLRNLYNAIKDGYIKPEVAFKKEKELPVTTENDATALEEVNNMFGGAENASNNG